MVNKICTVCYREDIEPKDFVSVRIIDVCKDCIVDLVYKELRRKQNGQRESRIN